MILFKPLTRDNIGGIIELLLAELNRRLETQQIRISLTDEAKQLVIERGYDPVYGARPLRRYLQQSVETIAAKLILGGGIIALGGLCLLIEFLLHVSFSLPMLWWSLYPLTVLFLLGTMLIIIGLSPPLRRSLHKKFFL